MKKENGKEKKLAIMKPSSGTRYKCGCRGLLAGRPLIHFECESVLATFNRDEYEEATALAVLDGINAATAGMLAMRPESDRPYATPAVLIDLRGVRAEHGVFDQVAELLSELKRANVPDVVVVCDGSWELPHNGQSLFEQAVAGETPFGLPVPPSWMKFDEWWELVKRLHPEVAREAYVLDVVIVSLARGVSYMQAPFEQNVAHELLLAVNGIVTDEDLLWHDRQIQAVDRGVFSLVNVTDAVFAYPEWRLDHTERICL